jgi:hypothetical protein
MGACGAWGAPVGNGGGAFEADGLGALGLDPGSDFAGSGKADGARDGRVGGRGNALRAGAGVEVASPLN